jgi:hypothetical protein
MNFWTTEHLLRVCPTRTVRPSDHARSRRSDGLGIVSVLTVTGRGGGPSRQPEGEVAAVVGGGREVGRSEVPPDVLGVPDGVGRSVALPVVVGSPVGVGWSRVGSGVVVGAVGVGWGAGAVVDAGTWLPVPLVTAAVVSGLT